MNAPSSSSAHTTANDEEKMMEWVENNSNSYNNLKEVFQNCPYTPKDRNGNPIKCFHRKGKGMVKIRDLVKKKLVIKRNLPPLLSSYNKQELRSLGYKFRDSKFTEYNQKRVKKNQELLLISKGKETVVSDAGVVMEDELKENSTGNSNLEKFKEFVQYHKAYDDFRSSTRSKTLEIPLILNSKNKSLAYWLVSKRHCTSGFFNSPHTVTTLNGVSNFQEEWKKILFIKLNFCLINTREARPFIVDLVSSITKKMMEPSGHQQLQAQLYNFLMEHTNRGKVYLGEYATNPVATATYYSGGIKDLDSKESRIWKVAKDAAIVATDPNYLGLSKLQQLCVSRCLQKLNIDHAVEKEDWTKFSAIAGVTMSIQEVAQKLNMEEADVEHAGCEYRKFTNNSGQNYNNIYFSMEDAENKSIITREMEILELIDLGDDME